MKFKVIFSNVQYVDGPRTIHGAVKKAKKSLKARLGNKLYRELITDVECKTGHEI